MRTNTSPLFKVLFFRDIRRHLAGGAIDGQPTSPFLHKGLVFNALLGMCLMLSSSVVLAKDTLVKDESAQGEFAHSDLRGSTKKTVMHDYDGDGRADVGVRRASNHYWYIRNSQQNTSSGDYIQRFEFGLREADIPLSGDFDGDGKTDFAFRRTSNQTWYIFNSSGIDRLTGNSDGVTRRVFGRDKDDIPVPADFDGDGKTDLAVYRPGNKHWYILNSTKVDALSGSSDGISRFPFGDSDNDMPVPADYDGDGKADIAVRNSANFTWKIRNSSGIDELSNNDDGVSVRVFGRNEADIPVPADFDADGKADIAVRRPSTSTWYVLNSSGSNYNSSRGDGIQRIVFGRSENDIPIAADYDGDGFADFAVRRPDSHIQYILNSTGVDSLTENEDGISRLKFGLNSADIPVAAPVWTKLAMLPCDQSQQNQRCGGEAANNPPEAVAQSLTTNEETALPITLSGTDRDGDTLNYSIVNMPQNGTLEGTPPDLIYTPNDEFLGSDSFSFTVTDGLAISTPASVSIAVVSEDGDNSPPVANDQSVQTNMNVPVSFVLQGSDIDGDNIFYELESEPQHGVLSGTLPNLTYSPNTDFVGDDAFTFIVDDFQEISEPARISITVAQTATGNSTPVATAQSVSTTMDTALAITLAGTDADGDTLTFAVATRPQNGMISGTAPNLTYIPSAGYMGSDSFTFTVSDGASISAPATVNISVTSNGGTGGGGSGGGHSHHCMAMPGWAADNVITHTAVQSGPWSNTTTWGGSTPPSNAYVKIPEGMTVTINSLISERFETVRIDGTLRFENSVNTQLNVDNLISNCSGALQLGTVDRPINADVTAKVVFIDDGAIDLALDPSILGRGAILMGRTEIYGAAKQAFTTVSQFPQVGDTYVQLANSPSGWRVGDRIVIAGTDPSNPTSDESRVITSIDGSRISFTTPLERAHVAPKSDLQVHVANLTRNVQFSSESQTIDRRGHVMIMHTNNASINYAWLDDMGRSDKALGYDDFDFPDLDPRLDPIPLGGSNIRGRYSLHFHKGGTSRSSTPGIVNGSVVTDDPGWAFVNHSSHVEFTNNVSHNIVGAAYYTEAGDEIGAFIGNIALRTVNPNMPLKSGPDGEEIDPDARENRQDFGFQGDGFWFHGPNVRVEDNVISGASGHAYIWWPEGLLEVTPEGKTAKVFHDTANVPNGDLIGPDGTRMQIMDVPMGTFKRNVGYSATKGVQIFYLHTEFFGDGLHVEDGTIDPPASYDAQMRSTLTDVTIWNVDQVGFAAPYCNRITTENLRIVGDGDQTTIGLDFGHFRNDISNIITNPTVEGFGIGVRLTAVGEVTLHGGTFTNNGTDVQYIIPDEDGGGEIVPGN